MLRERKREDAEYKIYKMMAPELDKQYSNIQLGEEIQICDIKLALKALRKKILSLDFHNSLHVHDPQNSFEYLEVLYKLRQLSERLGNLDPGGETKEHKELTVYADDLFEMAMARLEEEFVYLLTYYKQPLEQELLSFRSTEDGSTDEFSSSSFSEEQSEGKSTQTGSSGGSEYFVADLIQPGALSAVKSIANFMFLSDYNNECCQAYINARQGAIDEFIGSLHIDKHSMEELMSTKWNKLSASIKRWNRAMKAFVRVYLASERRLSSLVFGDLSETAVDLCFYEISFSSVMQLLSFYESVAIGPPKPEKLFRIVDMYEVLDDLLPEAEFLFQAGGNDMVLAEYHEVLLQLGESARKTFAEFKYAIQSYTSSSAVPTGAVHPLTKYVMNYVKAVTVYSKTLDSLLKDAEDFSADIQSVPHSCTHFTATALQLQSVAAVLEANLEAGSRLYRDGRLRNIFMMNNICYMVQKVKNSDLKSFLGDDWIRLHNRMFQHQATNYERASWSQVLSYLSDDGLCAAGDAASRKIIREKFKNFNLSFEDVYRVQTAWSVPDDQLREDVRISISLKVIQAYRTFVGRYSSFLDGTKQRDRYIKYRPEDLEELLLDLFEGTQKSLQHSGRA